LKTSRPASDVKNSKHGAGDLASILGSG